MNDERDLQKRYNRLLLLYQVQKIIHSSLDPKEALDLILREAVRMVRASSGSIVLINPNTNFLEIEAATGLPHNASGLRLRVGEGITGWVAENGKPARVGDVSKDSRYVMLKQDVQSELAVPLEVQGETRGVINVDSYERHAFSEDDLALLQELAVQAAGVIQNTWLYEQIRLKARLFEALVAIAQTINSALNLDDALQLITREACVLMNAKVASLMLLDESGDWLDLKASFGAGAAYVKKPRLNTAESLLGIVVRRKKPIQLDNVQLAGRYQNVKVARAEGLVSLLSVPLIFGGEAIGTLNVYSGEPHSFSNEEIKILGAMAELSAVGIEKARLYERIVDVEEMLRQNEKLSALGLLAAEVAHEIRNPLTVMKMLYHSLDLSFPSGDARNKDASIIAEKMEHLNKIVEQILAFARTSEPTLGPVDVNAVVEDLGLLTRHKLRNQNIELVKKLGADLPRVEADATHLEQAFLNLTLNAVEAMPDGGRLTISSARVQRRGETTPRVAIEFKDTGMGMPEEQRRRAFSSLLSTTKAKGTGLGLAIVAKIIESHGGKISVRSAVGKGTAIRIELPVAQG